MYEKKPRDRRIRCLETGKEFDRVSIAAKELGLSYSAINDYVLGVRKTPVSGLTFELIRIRRG